MGLLMFVIDKVLKVIIILIDGQWYKDTYRFFLVIR